jgi:aspartyl-tRNA(Asn)/glutamyl-tRNA(Gln) amidotransferase subunit C
MKKGSTITDDQVFAIAVLAKIHLHDTEVEKFHEELSSIVGYMDSIDELETTRTVQLNTPSIVNSFREDVEETSLSPQDATSSASSLKDSYFLIPAVLAHK